MPFRIPNRIPKPFSYMKNKYAGHPFRVFSATLKSLLLYHLVVTHFYSIEGTMGASMLPTLTVFGDYVLISHHYRRGRDIKPGDVVAFNSVVEDGEKVIKRVIGVEGDIVQMNTPASTSTSILDAGSTPAQMLQVPKGHCWVVGDNLPYSRDSRHFGPMPLALIRGKVVARVFPWRERMWFEKGLSPVMQDGDGDGEL